MLLILLAFLALLDRLEVPLVAPSKKFHCLLQGVHTILLVSLPLLLTSQTIQALSFSRYYLFLHNPNKRQLLH